MRLGADRTIARACLIAAVAWAIALPLAAYGAGHHTSPVFARAATLVYAAGAVVCHQRPERSFTSWDVSWPVCARCAGIYLGAAGAAALGLVFMRSSHRVDRSTNALPIAVAMAAVPSLATLVYEWSSGIVPGNAIRMLAGLPIGGVVIAAITIAGARASLPLDERVR